MGKYYKVVGIEDSGAMVSSYIKGDMELKYKIGETTIPKVGKIFAFRKYEDALRYLTSGMCTYQENAILEGIGLKAKQQPRLILNVFPAELNITFFKKFWSREMSRSGLVSIAPLGTVFLDSFTPTSIIQKG